MALISVTRLRLRSPRFLPAFAWHTFASARQVRRAPGFLGGWLAGEAGLGGSWTITAWRDEAAMRAFRSAGAHMKAMPKLLHWCDEASVLHWEQETAMLPEMPEARRRMVAEGRISKVLHPSPTHAAKRIEPRGTLRAALRLRPSPATP